MKFQTKHITKLRLLTIVFFLPLLTIEARAMPRDVKTARLISTSGAGIGSLLLNEAAFLNPASIFFFNNSSFYYQQGGSNFKQSPERDSEFEEMENQIFLITDTSSALKGGFSYQTISENGDSRKRFTSSASSNLGKNTAAGIIYRYTEEDAEHHEVYHQAVFGITHIVNERLTAGAILVDPFLANREDVLSAAGVQYQLTPNFALIGDAGANYKDEPEENNYYAVAAQAQFFKKFFLRFGQFENNAENLRGHSWGLSWVGPRLSFDYATRRSEVFKDISPLNKGEKIIDHSFALTLVF